MEIEESLSSASLSETVMYRYKQLISAKWSLRLQPTSG